MEILKNQESICEKLMISLENRNINYKENKDFLYQRAKLIGMIEFAQSLKIDADEFTWIYNAI